MTRCDKRNPLHAREYSHFVRGSLIHLSLLRVCKIVAHKEMNLQVIERLYGKRFSMDLFRKSTKKAGNGLHNLVNFPKITAHSIVIKAITNDKFIRD
jgi:hypothetical protein